MLAIYRGILERVEAALQAREKSKAKAKAAPIQFTSHGDLSPDQKIGERPLSGRPSNPGREKRFAASRKPAPLEDVLESAGDWKLQFDVDLEGKFTKSKPFPPEIAIVSGVGSRPDGVVWSMETKTVIIIELTSPWEENFEKNHKLKLEKYNQLVVDLRDGNHFGVKWKALFFCVEIGARGALHESAWGRMCGQLRITGSARKRLTAAVQDTAIHCSHLVYLCRFHKKWEPQALMDLWRKGSVDAGG